MNLKYHTNRCFHNKNITRKPFCQIYIQYPFDYIGCMSDIYAEHGLSQN